MKPQRKHTITHTAAPWCVEGRLVAEDLQYLIISAGAEDEDGKRRVALIGAWDLEGEENARLIAAAPRLLAACRAVVDRGDEGHLAEVVRRCAAAVAEVTQSDDVEQAGASPPRVIGLPCYGIKIRLDRRGGDQESVCGLITSDLRDPKGNAQSRKFNAAIDGLEALILAHACAGVDVESPAYIEGIETAVDALGNNL